MRQQIPVEEGFKKYRKITQREQFFKEMDQDHSLGGVVGGNRDVLSSGRGQGSAAGGCRAHATHPFLAALVQPVGPGDGRDAVRFPDDTSLREHRAGPGTGTGRKHHMQVPPSAGMAQPGEHAVCPDYRGPSGERPEGQHWHHRARHHHQRLELDQEQGSETGFGDASDYEGQPVALWLA